MPRSAEAIARDASTPSSREKLRLADSLAHATHEAVACQLALDWLHSHAGVRTGLAALLREGETLEGVAGIGAVQARVLSLRVDTRDRSHPFVAPLRMNTVLHVPGAASAARTASGYGLERSAHLVVPLWGSVDGTSREPLGILALHEPRKLEDRLTHWVATSLAQRLAVLRCVRARDEAQRELRETRALLERIVASVPDPIVLTDGAGLPVLANARASTLFTAAQSDSEPRRRAVAVNNMVFTTSFTRGAEARNELLLVDPDDGGNRLYEVVNVDTPATGAVRTISILRNVTDLRRATQEIEANLRKLRLAEADVRAERDRLDVIIDSVADPILVTDPSGEIVLMNVPAEHLFTVTATNPREDAHEIVRANEGRFGAFVANLAFSGHGTRWRGEIALADPATNKPMPVEAIAGRISGEHGDLVAVVTILHDRTEAIENARLYAQLKEASSELERKVREATFELVRQNELLQRQALELEQASNLKSQFLANVSHEFRTPLNAILGYTSMLLQGVSGEVSTTTRKHLSRVDSNARHLLAIISDILDIARIESGRMPVNATDFSLDDLVAEIGAELEPIIDRASVEVLVERDADMPTLRTDRQKVKQIVLNLLSNALKFTHQGSIRVQTRFDGDGDQVTIEVRDTGIGIDPKNHEKVFEDFQQADNSTTRQYGGTGLGLSICRRLARMLGGDVTLSSQIGEGSTFTLSIPRRMRRK